jgi:hypothetical protein
VRTDRQPDGRTETDMTMIGVPFASLRTHLKMAVSYIPKYIFNDDNNNNNNNNNKQKKRSSLMRGAVSC